MKVLVVEWAAVSNALYLNRKKTANNLMIRAKSYYFSVSSVSIMYLYTKYDYLDYCSYRALRSIHRYERGYYAHNIYLISWIPHI